MQNWEKRFYSVILQRGKDYYRKKRVKILNADELSCQAIVRGAEPYYVQITLNDDYDINRASKFIKQLSNCRIHTRYQQKISVFFDGFHDEISIISNLQI